MQKGLTENEPSEPVQLSLTDENISQADYERLRSGEKVEVEKSAPASQKAASETIDESETSQTDGDETEDESESDETLEASPKKKSGTQRRIEKLVKQRTQAEQEREYWRQEALKAKAPPVQAQPEVTASPAGEPDANDFESATEFYKAHARWAAKEELKAVEESKRQEKLKTEAESKKTTFLGKVDEFKKAHDDFESVIADVDDIQMSPAISQAILESDNGPELMYELAKNVEEYARMCALPPFEAIRALGRFEARLAKPSEETKVTKPKITTKAPPPPRPISTSSANGKKSVYDDDISQADYERMRAEQEKRRAHY
jgi:hypothetical protein